MIKKISLRRYRFIHFVIYCAITRMGNIFIVEQNVFHCTQTFLQLLKFENFGKGELLPVFFSWDYLVTVMIYL